MRKARLTGVSTSARVAHTAHRKAGIQNTTFLTLETTLLCRQTCARRCQERQGTERRVRLPHRTSVTLRILVPPSRHFTEEKAGDP